LNHEVLEVFDHAPPLQAHQSPRAPYPPSRVGTFIGKKEEYF
jgi:hypothetical protein